MSIADRSIPDPERFRGYLRALAARDLGRLARSKVDPSDLVQETLMDAVRGAGQFRGRCEAEMAGWLRRLLACNVSDLRRAMRRARRDTAREVPLDRDGFPPGEALAGGGPSPSSDARRREASGRVAEALARLPESSRRAVTMRYIEGRPIAEIAAELGRSHAAVAGLLKRGLSELRRLVPDEHGPGLGGGAR